MTTTDISPETTAWLDAHEDYTSAALRYGSDRNHDATAFGFAVEGLVANVAEIHRYSNIGLADVANYLAASRDFFIGATEALPDNGFGLADDTHDNLRLFRHAAEYLLSTIPVEVRR